MLTIGAATVDGAAQTAATGTSPAVVTDVSAANINITPRRVIFSGSKRAEAVYVFNRGLVPVTVDVKLADNFMAPSGQIAPLSAVSSGDSASVASAARFKSAGQLLLATPSRISLAPGAVKVVRIRALQPSQGAGEWRSHLTFTAIPPADSGVTAEQVTNPSAGEFAFKVRAIFGLSIPLIVRGSGEPGRAAISGLGITPPDASDSNPTLRFELQRSGDHSVFGDIEVYCHRSGTQARNCRLSARHCRLS